MSAFNLEDLVSDVPVLQGLFITLMPDCLLYDSFVRAADGWVPDEVASYFGDLVRANREGLKSLRSWSADMQVTIESADTLVILREIRGDFVAGFVFDRKTPLGMVRLHTRRVLERLEDALPKTELSERSPAVRVLEFVQRYAPDPHTALLRVSLKSGLTLEQLEDPEDLDTDAAARIEDAAKDILGLDSLAV